MNTTTSTWSPPKTLEERLKEAVIPASLYIRMRATREWRRGEPELKLLPLLVDDGKNAADVGANKGVWSWFLARMVPIVHAFEPNPKAFSILQRGAASNVVCHSAALSNVSGRGLLNVPKRAGGYSNQGATLRVLPDGGGHGSLDVETRRLDDLELQNIGFMKVDVEGHELCVLEGARETLARCRPVLIVEIEEVHTGRPVSDQVEEVEAHGYTCMVLHRGRLRSFGAFNTDLRQSPKSQVKSGGGGNGIGEYVFNFIFLPAE